MICKYDHGWVNR